jgi:predicted nucleic acid-binding protein
VILVDTSVWIDHFRRSVPELVRALGDGAVVSHPFVLGELALGRLGKAAEAVDLLGQLPALQVATHDQVLEFVRRHDLSGRGIGWVDAHLLAAAHAAVVPIWTHDRRLRDCAARLGLTPRHIK